MERHESVHDLRDLETLNVDEYTCLRCCASDRDRLCALYLGEAACRAMPKCQCRFIFAPAPALSSLPSVEYDSVDLSSALAGEHGDITSLPYAGESVDALLCAHVLEHVRDDGKAMAKLFRILKRGGWGIVMVPIPLSLQKTIESESLTRSERWWCCGQDDHVGMYSKGDYVSRLTSARLAVHELGAELFGHHQAPEARHRQALRSMFGAEGMMRARVLVS